MNTQTDVEELLERLCKALEQVTGFSVKCLDSDSWKQGVCSDGCVTLLEALPKQFDGLKTASGYCWTVASGQNNTSPGFDVLRHDPKDSPFIYNTDWYSVIEYLPDDDRYLKALNLCSVKDSEELRNMLRAYSFTIGPQKTEDHWTRHVPRRIAKYHKL